MTETFEDREVITKEIVIQFLTVKRGGVDVFDIQSMYAVSKALGLKELKRLLTICTLSGDLSNYHNLIANLEGYKVKYLLL